MLEPLTRATLPDQAARAIKQYILSQHLRPGDQLPSERYLTEMLSVSRTVVREALQVLVAEGVLQKAPSRGVFVRAFDGQAAEVQVNTEQPAAAPIRGLLEVRAALEIGALTFVAQRMHEMELTQLAELVAEMRQRLEAGQSIAVQDRTFHEVLLAAVHNPTFTYFKHLVQDAIQTATEGQPLTYVRPADRNTVETAEQLVQALRQRDVEKAQRAMHAHLLIDRPPEQARVFLFVDDAEIAEQHNLVRRVNQATKYPHNPVLAVEHPWEGEGVTPSATVLYDNEQMLYRMWYHGYQQLSPREQLSSLCYATSLDGIHWTKPALDSVEFNGTRENNLVMPWGAPQQADVISASILATPADDSHAHYTMLYFGAGLHSQGVCLATSLDGLHWTPLGENPVESGGVEPVGDVLYCIAEPAADRVAAYYRIPLRARPQAMLGRMESHDLRHWTGHRVILATDAQDPPDAELYGLTPFRYGELTLGLLWVYRRESGASEVQLACSRDGVQWTRVGERRAFIEPCPTQAFDHLAIGRTSVPLVVGNELWFYYAGTAEPPLGWKGPRQSIGLATITLDRFVALMAGADEGCLTTVPILCHDQTYLLLNAVVNPGGYLWVEVLDTEGQPIPGFTRQAMTPFEGSVVYHRVTWQAHEDLSPLVGRSIRFRFVFLRASLYAFRLAHPTAGASDLVAGIC
ncbi:MAG: GntR family transcriptional regulator [Caldilineaceae bacterium]